MHFSKLAVTLALAFTATAIDDIVNPSDPHLSLEEQCVYRYQFRSIYQWNVVIPDADDYTDDECGSGFLDNIDGRGCSVTNWGCNYADDETTMNANFAADLACGDDDISAAINAAFGGKSLDCVAYDDEVDTPGY
ncbi:hypothetical protein FQN54_002515 [Arachnomyces sp. PD_36]|nr:hypothetical protein FQN54_002515 [Arachnomyces sp. PD_36]